MTIRRIIMNDQGIDVRFEGPESLFARVFGPYNELGWVSWGGSGGNVAFLYKNQAACGENGKGWSVRVPPDCIIEFTAPCKTYQAADTEPWKIVGDLRREIESLKRKLKKDGRTT